MISPEVLPSGVVISKLATSTDETSGTINSGGQKKVKVLIYNPTNSSLIVNLGIASNITNELGIPASKVLVTGSNTVERHNIKVRAINGEYANKTYENQMVLNNTASLVINPTENAHYDSISCSEGSYNTLNNTLTITSVTTNINNCVIVFKSNNEANIPSLVQGLIPVVYDEDNGWVKADSTNTNNSWYNYDNKQWANAVLVREYDEDTNPVRSTIMSAPVGTPISEDDVLAYYVWIPRYKYRVWNINKVELVDSYGAETTGIDIMFESGTSTTGTITCGEYSFAEITSDDQKSQECHGYNLPDGQGNEEYYTHPAFTFGNTSLRGIWVGKFEISSEDPTLTSGGGNSTALTVRVLPNVTSWRSNYASNYFKVIYDMQITNNIYGLSTDRTNADSHMMKNMEWGSVAYLTNSEYGRCNSATCTGVILNNSSTYITGNARDSSVTSETVEGVANAYNTTDGVLASTTGNIYGIYDMSGGTHEYVMGNISNRVYTGYTYYKSSAGNNYTYTGYEKYMDTYAYAITNNTQASYNRARLGDATGEIVYSRQGKGWYSNDAYFPNVDF